MQEKYDAIIVGGGLAGISAAIAASRLGCTVGLVQDRPVLGGNSSSEIRVPIGGACEFNPWARETGIIEELFTENRVSNPRPNWAGEATSVWDLILYDAIKKAKGIDLFLETYAREVVLFEENDKQIKTIRCFQRGSEKEIILQADLFIDATGDGTIAYLAGAETRMGRETKEEFHETLAPDVEDNYTQGSSLLFHAVDIGKPAPFFPPDWAPKYLKDEDLPFRTHEDVKTGYWWIEIGAPPYNTITDNDIIRHELVRQLLAVWDHIKNHGDHGADNLVLDWVGMVPGKRESRRIMGEYVLCENDVRSCTLFPDRVAYGGWFIDLHTPGGILAKDQPPEPTFPSNREETDKRQVAVYSIPFRSLYSKDIGNLMMAGRDISVTHVVLGTTRLMGTCAIIGQAVGTATYLCRKYQIAPKDIYHSHKEELQQLLLKQDCFIPQIKNEDPQDMARNATVKASSSASMQFEEGELGEIYDYPRQKYISLSNLQDERAQLFPVSSDRIEKIEALLESHCSEPAQVELNLYSAETVWDFTSEKSLKTVIATVPPDSVSWITFEIDMPIEPHKLYWIALKSHDEVFWRYRKKTPSSTVSACRIVHRWALQRGSYSIRLSPTSYPYETENIMSGVSRPEKWTNIWISDPNDGFPQHVEVDFGKEVTFDTIYLTFDTNLSIPHMSTPPLSYAPECTKDYALFYEYQGKWEPILNIEGNYHRRRIHHFDDISSQKIRLEIYSTNGDPSARLYEIRVYKEK